MRTRTDYSLIDALDDLGLLADQRPDKFDRAAVRWPARLEAEAMTLSLGESQLALAALGRLRMDDREGFAVLQRLLRACSRLSLGAFRERPVWSLKVYAHLFDQRRRAEASRSKLEASFGTMLESTGDPSPIAARKPKERGHLKLVEVAEGG